MDFYKLYTTFDILKFSLEVRHRGQNKENCMTMFIQFICFCPLGHTWLASWILIYRSGFFPSCLVPLFQNESSCKNENKFDLHENERVAAILNGFVRRIVLTHDKRLLGNGLFQDRKLNLSSRIDWYEGWGEYGRVCMASVVKKQFLWVSFRSSWLVVKHFVVNCKQSLSSSKIKEACETLMPRTARSAGVGRATPALLAACGIAARMLRSQSRSPAYFCFVFPHGFRGKERLLAVCLSEFSCASVSKRV